MTEFGAVAIDHDMKNILSEFHGVLVDSIPDPENPAIPYFTEDATRYDATEIMRLFDRWVRSFGERAIFVSDNNGFDAMWITYAFDQAGIKNPFGHSSRRIGDFFAGTTGNYRNSSSWKKLRRTKHDHNPVNDARGNAEALMTIIDNLKGR